MAKVQNNRKGDITLVNDSGDKFVLVHGINEDVPDWVGRLKYAGDLHEAGDILVVDYSSVSQEPPRYLLDDEGNPVQAQDDEGNLMFDEESGQPIFVPAVEE